MALFKIQHGGETRLPSTKHTGWAYVTYDKNRMYIDVNKILDDKGTADSTVTRIQLYDYLDNMVMKSDAASQNKVAYYNDSGNLAVSNLVTDATNLTVPGTLTVKGSSSLASAAVSGTLTVGGASTLKGLLTTNANFDNILSSTSDAYIRTKNTNGQVGILVSTNRGLYDYTNAKWIININSGETTARIGTWASVGSSTNPVYFNSAGQPVKTTYSLNAGISSAAAGGRLAYYSSTTTIGSYDSTVGSGTKFMYLNAGVPTASASTVASGTKLMYLNAGTLTASTSSIAGATQLMYLSSGALTASTSTIGANAQPVYLNKGVVTASTASVGSSAVPVYIANGTFTACSGTLNLNAKSADQVNHTLSVNGKGFNGSADVTVGTMGIAYGGTGATTAVQAYVNLLSRGAVGAVSASDAVNAGRYSFVNTTTNTPIDSSYGVLLNITSSGTAWNKTDNWIWQIGLTTSNQTPWIRNAVNKGDWSSWVAIMTSSNYNSWVPSLTGTGATGNWNINITGNAKTATTAVTATNVANSGTATNSTARHVWFSRDDSETQRVSSDNFKYTPSTNSLSVNIAGNAATATALTSSAGSATQPIYFSGGKPVACTYALNAGISSASAANKLAYYSSTTAISAVTNTYGSNTKPVYVNAGVLTASTATVGSATLPVYMNAGSITACNSTLGVNITGGMQTPNTSSTSLSYLDYTGQVTTASWLCAWDTSTYSGKNVIRAISPTNLRTAIAAAPSSGSQQYVRVANSNQVGASSTMTFNDLAAKNYAMGMIYAATDNPAGAASWHQAINLGWSDGAGTSWVSQIAINTSAGSGMYYRSSVAASTSIVGRAWTKLVDASNYTNYTVTKTGSGASGTWGISITGNAASASKLTVNAGSSTSPIYFANGVPVACASTIANNTSGNAATATKLQTARTINGTSFNGTANITTANWGTARTITIGSTGKSVNGSGNVSWSLAEIGAAAASHSHSYLPLSGGTLTGRVLSTYTYKGSWATASGSAPFFINTANSDSAGNSYQSWFGGKTQSGSWTIGFLSGYEDLYFSYVNSSDTSNCHQVHFGSAGTVYGAVWNDYAEFRESKEEIKPGYCVISNDDGTVQKTTERFQACDGIVSDTFGFAIGETDECKTPLAVAGRVLAYCAGDRNDYHAGDTVCAGPEGRVVKMTREEVREWPDRIVGIVSEIPSYETWGTGNVEVDGRIWIKVK